MPRITSRRVETPALQGEGSYVVFRRISWKLAKDARKFLLIGNVRDRKDMDKEQIERLVAEEERLTLEAVFNGIIEWNWQDEDGKPLPIPKTGEELDALTADEVVFLVSNCTSASGQDQLTESKAKN